MKFRSILTFAGQRYRPWYGLLVTALLCASITPAMAMQSRFCPPLPSPKAAQKSVHIASGDVSTLLETLRTARRGTTLLLADGIYTLAPNQSLEVSKPGVTIRGASGRRAAVIIEGGDNTISINADDVTVADITLRNPTFHAIQVRGEVGLVRPTIYNVHLVDAGQQFVKVSTGDGSLGKFADAGLVACSLIEYTTYARGTDSTPPSYTNGVDILAGKDWVIRDNIFRRIRSQAGPAGPAVLAWKNAMNTLIQRNLILDSWRGIALGLSAPDALSRGGAHVVYDHQDGLVENNVILALHKPADAAIENNYAFNSRIINNIVYYNEEINHVVKWSIEYRFIPTKALIKGNNTNFPVIKRDPYPEKESIIKNNTIHTGGDWFIGIIKGNLNFIDIKIFLSEADTDVSTR